MEKVKFRSSKVVGEKGESRKQCKRVSPRVSLVFDALL